MNKSILNILSLVFLLLSSCSKSNDPNTPSTPDIKFETLIPNIFYNNAKTSLKVMSDQKLDKVEFYLDDQSVGSTIGSDYTVDFYPIDIASGDHKLTIVATIGTKSLKKEETIKFVLRIGDGYKGGRIFYLSNDNKTGLVANDKDLVANSNDTFTWGPNTLVGASSLDDGQVNSDKIKNFTNPVFLYNFIKTYSDKGYSDWYVPSYNEMGLFKAQIRYMIGFPLSTNQLIYWTSTENNASTAYVKNLLSLQGESGISKSLGYRIRLIRKF